MALLLDNDVVHKLAQLDLLDDAEVLLRKEFNEIYVLDTLKYKFCPINEAKRVKAERKYGINNVKRIESFISGNICEINAKVQDEILIRALASYPDGLDAGEMQLLQVLIDNIDDALFTGDKRFLKALANIEELQARLLEVQGRFVCFEQIIYFLIKQLGFQKVKTKFIAALDGKTGLDTTLKMCFEGQHNAIEERVIENIGVQISYVTSESGKLLSSSLIWQPIEKD